MNPRTLRAREPGHFFFQRGDEDGQVFVHYHMVKEVFALSEECEVFLRILEPVSDMRLGFAPPRTEPVEQLAEPRTLALAGREESERKDCAAAIVMGEPLEQFHFRHDDGNFARIPNRLDVGGAVPVPPDRESTRLNS